MIRPRSPAWLIARALTGAWRAEPPPLQLTTEELRQLAPLLLAFGAAPLVWPRLQPAAFAGATQARALEEQYRYFVLRDAARDRQVASVFRALTDAGINGILFKGWAAAQLYARPELRPHGDVDVLVRSRDLRSAKQILDAPGAAEGAIEIHTDPFELQGRSFEALFNRSRRVSVAGTEIVVMGAEDHLAAVTIHALKHGVWRPGWLCDIAAAVESAGPGFDWERCLGIDGRRATWVRAGIGLATTLVGARAPGASAPATTVPNWVLDSILRQWESVDTPSRKSPSRYAVPMAMQLRQPRTLLPALAARWPNPIEATIRAGGPIDAPSSLPYQLRDIAIKAARLAHAAIRKPARQKRG